MSWDSLYVLITLCPSLGLVTRSQHLVFGQRGVAWRENLHGGQGGHGGHGGMDHAHLIQTEAEQRLQLNPGPPTKPGGQIQRVR